MRKFQAPKFLNPKSQNTNIKQITMTEIQNIKPVLVIEKLRFEIYLEFGAWNLEFYILLFGALNIVCDFQQVPPVVILHHVFRKVCQLISGDVAQAIGKLLHTGNF